MGKGGLQLATVCTAINGTVLEDVRMSRHGAEMAHPTYKSIENHTLGVRSISEYKRMTQREGERGRVLWRNDAKQMTRWVASSEGEPAGKLMGGGRIAADRGGEAIRSQKGEARLIN